jgi:hypothetical protein
VVEHLGVAVNGAVVPPISIVADDGAIATEFRVGVVEMVMITGELWVATLFRVAFTNSPTVPEELPAVMFTEAPMVVLSLASVLLKVHE